MAHSKSETEVSFQPFITADGSCTLVQKSGNGESRSEGMHSERGAFSESLYVYGECFSRSLSIYDRLSVLSVGLGLGYNELITVAQAIHSRRLDDLKIYSYESHKKLRKEFLNWLNNQASSSLFSSLFSTVLERVGLHFTLSPPQLKAALRHLYSEGRLQVFNVFSAQAPPPEPVNVVFFDAYSKKTSPELWNECLWTKMLCEMTDVNCLLATYASQNWLKKALLENGFTLERREGFGGKRECTLAYR